MSRNMKVIALSVVTIGVLAKLGHTAMIKVKEKREKNTDDDYREYITKTCDEHDEENNDEIES